MAPYVLPHRIIAPSVDTGFVVADAVAAAR
jgi:hypothetical protein